MVLFNIEKKEEKAEEKWIWVEGFKGTKKDMTCNGYQYELGKTHNMSEDSEIEECKSGFHLCLSLAHVFEYYKIVDDNRFFKVRALVREDDVARYDHIHGPYSFNRGRHHGLRNSKDKLVAKSIEFISECTMDDIFSAVLADDIKNWTDDDKTNALTLGVRYIAKVVNIRTLTGLGYSAPFATFLVDQCMFELAEAVGSQADLSMDMKVWMIMSAINVRRSEIEQISKYSAMLRKSLNF